MVIEIVLRSNGMANAEPPTKFTIKNVDTVEFDVDHPDVLCVHDMDGCSVADFRDWAYWRKVGEDHTGETEIS